jgi:hypothetical protein
VYGLNNEIKLNETGIKTALKLMMAPSEIDSFAEIARHLNINETTFRSALNNNSLRVTDLLKTSDLFGYEIVIKKK